jgi:hypothetical protein
MLLSPEPRIAVSPAPVRPRCALETLHEQGSGLQNEDVVLRAGDLLGVFDGATSLDGFLDRDGATGGYRAAQLAAQVFADEPGDLASRAQRANRAIRSAQHDHGIPFNQRQRLWSTSMAVVRLHDGWFEYCQVGDSMILLLYRDGRHELLTPEIDIDIETLQQWKRLPASAPPIQISLASQILAVRLQMNVRYGVLNGEPESLSFLSHGRRSLSDLAGILLFTDGLQLPKSEPGDPTDWQWFADLYRLGGLAGIRNHVRMLQRQDPDCRQYPRFKRHDDIAAVAVTLPAGTVSPHHKPH